MSYFVNKNENVDHNGKSYKSGEEIKGLSAKDAERLLRLGAVVEDGEPEQLDDDKEPVTDDKEPKIKGKK